MTLPVPPVARAALWRLVAPTLSFVLSISRGSPKGLSHGAHYIPLVGPNPHLTVWQSFRAQVILSSEGFSGAKDLASKIVSMFTLSKQLLSTQQHYDWGLRALKAVLNTGGKLIQVTADYVFKEEGWREGGERSHWSFTFSLLTMDHHIPLESGGGGPMNQYSSAPRPMVSCARHEGSPQGCLLRSYSYHGFATSAHLRSVCSNITSLMRLPCR